MVTSQPTNAGVSKNHADWGNHQPEKDNKTQPWHISEIRLGKTHDGGIGIIVGLTRDSDGPRDNKPEDNSLSLGVKATSDNFAVVFAVNIALNDLCLEIFAMAGWSALCALPVAALGVSYYLYKQHERQKAQHVIAKIKKGIHHIEKEIKHYYKGLEKKLADLQKCKTDNPNLYVKQVKDFQKDQKEEWAALSEKIKKQMKYAYDHDQFQLVYSYAHNLQEHKQEQLSSNKKLDVWQKTVAAKNSAEKRCDAKPLEELIKEIRTSYDKKLKNEKISLDQLITLSALRDAVILRALKEGKTDLLLANPFLFEERIALAYQLGPVALPPSLGGDCNRTAKAKHGTRGDTLTDAHKSVNELNDNYRDFVNALETNKDIEKFKNILEEKLKVVREKLEKIGLKGDDKNNKTLAVYYNPVLDHISNALTAVEENDLTVLAQISPELKLAFIQKMCTFRDEHKDDSLDMLIQNAKSIAEQTKFNPLMRLAKWNALQDLCEEKYKQLVSQGEWSEARAVLEKANIAIKYSENKDESPLISNLEERIKLTDFHEANKGKDISFWLEVLKARDMDCRK